MLPSRCLRPDIANDGILRVERIAPHPEQRPLAVAKAFGARPARGSVEQRARSHVVQRDARSPPVRAVCVAAVQELAVVHADASGPQFERNRGGQLIELRLRNAQRQRGVLRRLVGQRAGLQQV